MDDVRPSQADAASALKLLIQESARGNGTAEEMAAKIEAAARNAAAAAILDHVNEPHAEGAVPRLGLGEDIGDGTLLAAAGAAEIEQEGEFLTEEEEAEEARAQAKIDLLIARRDAAEERARLAKAAAAEAREELESATLTKLLCELEVREQEQREREDEEVPMPDDEDEPRIVDITPSENTNAAKPSAALFKAPLGGRDLPSVALLMAA